MLRLWICSFLLFCGNLIAEDIQLKGKLAEARPGSYLVIEQNKIFTFFHIHDRFDQAIVIEEVSVPAANFMKNRMNWKTWFESGAPGHTSWMMSQVNLTTGAFEETFSFTHRGWIDMSSSSPFLTTLLNLRFHEVSFEDRRRIGLPPGYNKADHRPLWNPRLVVNGMVMADRAFIAYKAKWPSDGTELARKTIEIYLPAESTSPEMVDNGWFPAYFPYWLEVEGKIGSAKARVVDSGFDATSPQPTLPKRSPQLMGDAECSPTGISFRLKSPLYYKEFLIFAEESDSFFGNMTLLPCTTTIDGETVSLSVTQEELQKLPNPEARYRFTISPKENPSLVLETRVPIKLNAL